MEENSNNRQEQVERQECCEHRTEYRGHQGHECIIPKKFRHKKLWIVFGIIAFIVFTSAVFHAGKMAGYRRTFARTMMFSPGVSQNYASQRRGGRGGMMNNGGMMNDGGRMNYGRSGRSSMMNNGSSCGGDCETTESYQFDIRTAPAPRVNIQPAQPAQPVQPGFRGSIQGNIQGNTTVEPYYYYRSYDSNVYNNSNGRMYRR